MGTAQSRIDPQILNDLLRDTSYTEEEILEGYKTFSKTYPKDCLTLEEYKAEFQKKFPDGDASDYAEHLFRYFDENSDGSLNFRDYFKYIYLTSSRARTDEKIKFLFTVYDIDRNGHISWEEIHKVLRSVYVAKGRINDEEDEEYVKKRIKEVYQNLDRNMDGKIMFNEFAESVTIKPQLAQMLRSDILSFGVLN